MSLGRNVVANFLGQGWAALLGLLFVPAYATALGMEAYGLVGAFAILFACMSILDFGISPTITRELARLRAGAHSADSARDLLRSLEVACTVIAAAMALILWILSDVISRNWLTAETLSQSSVSGVVKIMALLLAARWLEQVYRGALQGLEDFVWINVAQAFFATLRWCGAYVVVVYVDASIHSFFVWQVLVSALTMGTLITRTYYILPPGLRNARFSLTALLKVRRYATGMFAVSVLALALTQMDRFAISTLLPLDQLGLYSIAAAAAGGLMQIVTPINVAIYPRLTQLVTMGDQGSLRHIYIRACEWMAFAIVPPAILMVTLPQHVLLAWSGNQELAIHAAALLQLLAAGSLCNALMSTPYAMQLAHGWTGLAVRVNVVAVVVTIPAMFWATSRFGAPGAAGVWFSLNASYVLIGAHFMYRTLVPDIKWKWYAQCVASPLVAALVTAAILLATLPQAESRPVSMAVCVASMVFLYAATGLCLSGPRQLLFRLTKWFRKA